MTDNDTNLEIQIAALEAGRAFVDRTYLHKTRVGGTDAATWLNDLVTAGVEGLAEGRAVRSLLLSPTGHILAEFHVVRVDDGFILLQEPGQPEPVEGLLSKYVLSSKITLGDVTDSVSAFETADGIVLARPGAAENLDEVSREAAEAVRIRRGEPAFPMDTGLKALPAEAGWESLVDFNKGCFLGQESVAKVRNLGHPPALVLGIRTRGPAGVGDPVFVEGEVDTEVGAITSVAPLSGGTAAIARVTWSAREEPLATMGLGELVPAARTP
jgi:folate-binding protein YgfZ